LWNGFDPLFGSYKHRQSKIHQFTVSATKHNKQTSTNGSRNHLQSQICLDEPNNCQQRTRLSSFDAKIVCQGSEPIPQIFDSSSMLSNFIDIQLAKKTILEVSQIYFVVDS
jgi:hypothetical protein